MYQYFDPKSQKNLKLVSKALCKNINDIKENYLYNVVDLKKCIAGSVRLICSKCFKEQCDCKTLKYHGLFVRKNSDGSMVKVYLPSSYIETIAETEKKRLLHPHLFPKPTIYVPTQYCPADKYKNKSGYRNNPDATVIYSQVTPPYIMEETSDLYVLESIPVISMINPTYYPMPNLDSVYETFLNQKGECIRRQAFFNFNETNYPFGVLALFPKLYETYKDRLRNQQCTIKRDEEKTIFYNDDFYADCCSEDEMKNILHKIFNMFDSFRSYKFKDRFYNNIAYNKENIYRLLEQLKKYSKIDPSIDFVHFALCAKECGNTCLSYPFVKFYDKTHQQLCIANYKHSLYKRPFGAIIGLRNMWTLRKKPGETTSDYDFVINQFTTLSNIPELITTIQNRKQLIRVSDMAAVEIRKDGTTYTLYPWKWSYVDVDWLRGSKFTLENCSGILNDISFNVLRNLENLKKITVTEINKNSEGSIKKTHILFANGTHTTTSNNCDNANKDSKNSIDNQQMTRFCYLQVNPIFAYIWNTLNIGQGMFYLHTKFTQLFMALRIFGIDE